MKVGEIFECEYPFKKYSYKPILPTDDLHEGWSMGCNSYTEMYSESDGCIFYNANGIGKIIFEVLAIVEMPKRYMTRVIYKFDRVDPDGIRINSSKTHTVTQKHFESMIENPYQKDWSVIPFNQDHNALNESKGEW